MSKETAEEYAEQIERMIGLRKGKDKLAYLQGLNQALNLVEMVAPATAKKRLLADLSEKIEDELFQEEHMKD